MPETARRQKFEESVVKGIKSYFKLMSKVRVIELKTKAPRRFTSGQDP